MKGSHELPAAAPQRVDNGATGDVYGRHMHMQDQEKIERKRRRRTGYNNQWRLETQNVRGFVAENIMRWLEAWRRAPRKEIPVAWMIQETHVSTQAEVERLQAEWKRLWGLQHHPDGKQLSYWSIDDTKTGGVAILLHPSVVDQVSPWLPDKWTRRVIAIKLRDRALVNVYAPNGHQDREQFFTTLQAWPWEDREILLAGDFNCVLSPVLDRLGGHRTGRAESAVLPALFGQLQLEDACTLAGQLDDGADKLVNTEYFTYWGPEAASRIDRLYVPNSWTSKVQWLSVLEPTTPSDHQRVILHLAGAQPHQVAKSKRRGLVDLIRTFQQTRVQEELLDALVEEGICRQETTHTWDSTVQKCGLCISRLTKQEKKRMKTFKHKLNAQSRVHLLTRKALLDVTMEERRAEHLFRLGQRLERTADRLRWDFKRASNWERDQTIASIRHIHGAGFEREMSLATKFSSEWTPILGKIHSTVPDANLEREFDKFVTIPENRKLSHTDNNILMEPVAEQEVRDAIAALNRHKAAGPDGLNNDFFKDTQSIFVPALTAISNELLKGGDPPQSFLEALIIPLKKKGDSDDAMDFRPISLLQTGYKIVTKVMVTRAQRVLGKPIESSQQGFVHGRQMMKTVMMMLAILATATAEPELAAALSRVVLLFDLWKAYDTVAREFLFVVLIRFRSSPEFVRMLRNLHEGTTARFLVNGELSDPQEVVSGIRQGCPLAPLLFILAAEVLALAIQQDEQTEGIQVPGTFGQAHKFSCG